PGDLLLGQSVAGQPFADHELVMGTEGVHGDGGADQVARLGEGTVLEHVVAAVRLLVGAVVGDDGGDRGPGGDEFEDRPVEGSPVVGVAGGGGLDGLGAAGGVAEPFQVDAGEVAAVGSEFGEGDGPRSALVAQDSGLPGAV